MGSGGWFIFPNPSTSPPYLFYRHPPTPMKLRICSWTFDFATGLKISYIYSNLTKQLFYHTQKTKLQHKFFGAKTKKLYPQTINRGNFFRIVLF